MLSRQLARLERAAQVAHRVLDGALRPEAEHAPDLVGVDVVGADVVGRRGDDRDVALLRKLLLDDALHDLRDLHDRQVLEADVEGLPGDLLVGDLEQELVEVDHVLDVQVRAHLRAAEHGDLAVVDRVVGQDVDRQVEPLRGRVAADRRRPDGHADEVRRLVLEQQRLAHALVLVVERERHERMVLGHVGRRRETP